MTGDRPPAVSLVMTIRDEATTLPALLESIRQQTLRPSEIIIVDGGSDDRSVEILRQWSTRLPLKVLEHPGASISLGRNVGIEQATSEIIAVTDAGVRLDRDWLQHLVAPLSQTTSVFDVSAGFFQPDPHNEFEAALAATTLPDLDEIDGRSFLPSSRSVAFRKSWFDAGVRYPEWLDYCEDLVFDLRLKQAGARFAFQPAAIARFRPRPDVRAFWNQYYRYARGDGKADLFRRRHLLRYLAYLAVPPSIVLVKSPLWRVLVLLGGIGYMRRPVQRLLRRNGGDAGTVVRLSLRAGLLRGVGDIAKMVGYPVGLLWRAQRYGLRRDWRSIPETRGH